MKRIAVLAVLLLALTTCADPYGSCSKAAADIGASIGTGMHTVDQIRQAGLISTTEESNVVGYLEFANKADEAFETCISTAHTSGNKPGTYTSCAQAFNASLNNPVQLALIKVGNSNASQQISSIVNGVATAVAAISAGLGGA